MTAPPAERVGRYQLLDPIGVGPTGSVSRAKVFGVAGFERQFAVKRFHAEITASTAHAQALSAAARSYGGLEHPRIARMSEFGVARGTTYTAVEYVAGLDAMKLVTEARLAGATLAVGGALALVSQAARAIGYAHGRGLTHLGLAPTNVIVTSEGDVKITDFGILAATLPAGPLTALKGEHARLSNRIAYLSPEQLAGEAVSAATDVFALGLLAYELVGSGAAYRGASPQAVAEAILAGPPGELPLPRPIARVLLRCLARSPFERFPDARALADSLDAAVRVAPVPGTRKDIGAHVGSTLERLAALRESEQSGMLAFNVGTGPVARVPVVATAGRGLGGADPVPLDTGTIDDLVTLDLQRPSAPNLEGDAGATQPELGRAVRTISDLAPPPPIPVPPLTTPPAIPPPRPKMLPTNTLVGGPTDRRTPASAPKRPSGIPPIPGPRIEPRPGTDLEIPVELGPRIDPEDQSARRARELQTDEMSPILKDGLNRAAVTATSEMEPLVADAYRADAFAELLDEEDVSQQILPESDVELEPEAPYEIGAPPEPIARATHPGIAPPPARTAGPRRPTTAPPPVVDAGSTAPTPPPPPSRSRVPLIVASILGAGALAAGAWFAYERLKPRTEVVVTEPPIQRRDAAIALAMTDAAVAMATPDAAVRVAAVDAAPAVPVDAAQVAVATPDAATPKPPPDAAAVAIVTPDAAVPVPIPTPGGGLAITTTPKGARVFLDGADVGVTPLELAGTKDRHSLALLLAGHDLYLGDIDGSGTFAIPLVALTPSGGDAGIKVLKCAPERYYVFVDGKPTGQTCPTERINTTIGAHTVEVYDLVSESRRKWDIDIVDDRLSFRVRVE